MTKPKRSELRILSSDTVPRNDGRVFCRFELKDVPVRLKDLKVGEKGEAVCKDISGGGTGIESPRELKPRTPLEMWFDLPDGFEPMHFLGKVVWSVQEGMSWRLGILFDKPKLMSLARILKLQDSESE